ncbi:TPA: hypothetical protein L6A37_35390, partial [Pseudomonas aeruginosa]|nr:hypothetical protein [Pseudomonas aeruginosa]
MRLCEGVRLAPRRSALSLSGEAGGIHVSHGADAVHVFVGNSCPRLDEMRHASGGRGRQRRAS